MQQRNKTKKLETTKKEEFPINRYVPLAELIHLVGVDDDNGSNDVVLWGDVKKPPPALLGVFKAETEAAAAAGSRGDVVPGAKL
jgi:hypothetical protein